MMVRILDGNICLILSIMGSNLKELIGWVIIVYIAFLTVYLIVTAVVYCVRYVYGRKRLRRYAEHVKKVRRMYYREEQMNR